MTELLDVERGHRVLEVGTGSGYHAAVLAELAGPNDVVTIERFPDLARRARRALERSGYGDVSVVVGDGTAERSRHCRVRFVPPVGAHGFDE